MKKSIVGIDISAKTLDICLKSNNQKTYFKIENSKKAIHAFFKKHHEKITIVAMENTGRFNWALYQVLPDFELKVFVINPLHLSKSQGLIRGKDDKIDAYRIAVFAQKNCDELPVWKPTSQHITKLKVLLTERSSRIKEKRRFLKQQHDYKKMKFIDLDKKLQKWNEQLINQLNKQIIKIECLIMETVESDETLKKQYDLMLSIPGVGKITAWNILCKTEGFKKITDPRKMACYAGVVPFAHQSGSSIYKKPRVSIFADKEMKSILHLAAMSAIRLKNDLQHYYLRKVKEGKNKMAVLNAVRNKIIHLIFAIVKSEKLFQNRLVTS